MGTVIERIDGKIFIIIASQIENKDNAYDYVSFNINNIDDFYFFDHDDIKNYKLINIGSTDVEDMTKNSEPLLDVKTEDIRVGAIVTLKNMVNMNMDKMGENTKLKDV